MKEKTLELMSDFFMQANLLAIDLTDPDNYKTLNKKELTFLNTYIFWKLEQENTKKINNDFSGKLTFNALDMLIDQTSRRKNVSEETLKTLRILDELVPQLVELGKQ